MHDAAGREEQRSGVPAGITTAQAILETGYGRTVPTDIETGKYSYNLFGIKAHGHPDYVSVWTHEEVNGAKIKIIDKFRPYESFEESIRGRTEFFTNNQRHKELLASNDAFFWADKLQEKAMQQTANIQKNSRK